MLCEKCNAKGFTLEYLVEASADNDSRYCRDTKWFQDKCEDCNGRGYTDDAM